MQKARPNNNKRVLRKLSSKAPCRVCLFGDHQDYLGFPVIAASIDVHVVIDAVLVEDDDDDNTRRIIELSVPSLQPKTIYYDLDRLGDDKLTNNTPDFCRAAIFECCSQHLLLQPGQRLQLTSSVEDGLPMQAGCSTSSAFVVALVQLLENVRDHPHSDQRCLAPIDIAKLAHAAEVTHFGNPGGTMDHIACSLGGLLRIGPEAFASEPIPLTTYHPAVLILVDSGEPKDTLAHLHRCKQARLDLLHQKLGGNWDAHKENRTTPLSDEEEQLLQATIVNRDTEKMAYEIFCEMVQMDHDSDDTVAKRLDLWRQLGQLMNQHHAALRDGLLLSTDRLEAIRTVALDAGAWGFKVVGSGGGGCGMCVAPASSADTVRSAVMPHSRNTWLIQTPGPSAKLEVVL